MFIPVERLQAVKLLMDRPRRLGSTFKIFSHVNTRFDMLQHKVDAAFRAREARRPAPSQARAG